MNRVFCLIGKSASGKDTVYRRLLEEEKAALRPVVLYTTRPIRAGETDGVEYRFISDEKLDAFETDGKLIEVRRYKTVQGIWSYATVDDGTICADDGKDALLIGTLESFSAVRDYYGKDAVIPLYVEVEDGLRLSRALGRERQQKNPDYAEMCRRFLADREDFSEQKLKEAGIEKRFDNSDLEACLAEIRLYLSRFL